MEILENEMKVRADIKLKYYSEHIGKYCFLSGKSGKEDGTQALYIAKLVGLKLEKNYKLALEVSDLHIARLKCCDEVERKIGHDCLDYWAGKIKAIKYLEERNFYAEAKKLLKDFIKEYRSKIDIPYYTFSEEHVWFDLIDIDLSEEALKDLEKMQCH